MTPRQRKQKRRLFLRRAYARFRATWWKKLRAGKHPLFGKLCKQMTKREIDARWACWGF
jgi:hypothetical protein